RSPTETLATKHSSEPSSLISTLCSVSSCALLVFAGSNRGSLVVSEELTVSPMACARRELINTHYRWVAQLWSTEECFVHAAKETARLEDEITPDCFRRCPPATTRKGGVLTRLLRARHWVSPKLHRPVGTRRKESFFECAVQSVTGSRTASVRVV